MALLSAPEIQKLYANALKLQNSGKFEDALRLYGQIIEANPKIAEAHYQIGRIFVQANRVARALPHFKAAIQLRPSEGAIWQAWADAVALLGDSDEEKTMMKALKTAPVAPAFRIELQDRFGAQRSKSRAATGGLGADVIRQLVDLMNARRFTEAESRAEQLLRSHPKAAVVANILATAQAALGKVQLALASYRLACKIDPNYAEAHDNFGQALLSLNRLDEALAEFRKAVTLAPDLVPALVNLAVALVKKGEPRTALPYAEKAVSLQPNHYPALIALGNTHHRLRNYKKSEEILEKAVAQTGGKSAEAVSLLGQTQVRLGKDDEALKNFDRALQLDPNIVVALGGKGNLLQALGQFEEAETYFRKVIELEPKNGDNYRLLFASHKALPDDPLIDKMITHYDDPSTSQTDRMNLAFAISKALEDIKDYPRVFKYLDVANGLMSKTRPYDVAERAREIDTVKALLDGIDWHSKRIAGTSDCAPIFVTGMPRSGTTLIEQIIASHSAMTAGGELGDAAREAHRLIMPESGNRPIASLTDEEIAGLGLVYEAGIKAQFPEAMRITDKSIQTYMYIGLLKLCLPRARFVVVRRDPRDNLLSIYKNKFPEGTHLYAYDQRDLAEYYTTFVDMIDFWRARVPDWFYEVQYEELVADPEPQTRKLIAACGLEWEDACLNFHENKRKIDTLSVFQARQPISRGSVKAWQRYESDLAPMLTALKDAGHVAD